MLFELLHRSLALIERHQMTRPFRENFVLELADDYEDLAVHDPDFEKNRDDIIREMMEILDHDSSEGEGIFFDQLSEKIKSEKS